VYRGFSPVSNTPGTRSSPLTSDYCRSYGGTKLASSTCLHSWRHTHLLNEAKGPKQLFAVATTIDCPSKTYIHFLCPSDNLSTTLVNDQLDVQFPYSIIRLLQSSTCFEQRRAHHQEVKLY